MQEWIHSREQFRIGGIAAQLPDHHSAEMLIAGIADFIAD